jgi:aryl-alcohol dehydrogenase-like predicted oxidoreductase
VGLTTPAGGTVGRIGFGCFALSGGYGSAEGVDASAVIRKALDLGINLLDTSDAYGAGQNEVLVGRAIAGLRDEVFLTTKFGWVLDAGGVPVRRDSSPAHVRAACDASLKRLGTDHIDLYLQHRMDPDTPVEATVGELIRLRDEGKIRGFGFCEVGSQTLMRATDLAPVTALQTEYSLWSRDPEHELLPLCQKLGILFMAYSPLGRGFLTGAIRSSGDLGPDDFRRTHPRFQEENLRANLLFVEKLNQLASGRNSTAAQLALAWVLAQPWGIMPIVATRSVKHLAENARALEIHLDASDLDEITAAIPVAEIKGERHPAEHMKTIEA